MAFQQTLRQVGGTLSRLCDGARCLNHFAVRAKVKSALPLSHRRDICA
jgi:hypothetical protein